MEQEISRRHLLRSGTASLFVADIDTTTRQQTATGISGRVRDVDGDPLATTVHLYGQSDRRLLDQAESGENSGTFRFEMSPSERTEIQNQYESVVFVVRSDDWFTVAVRDTTSLFPNTTLDLQLRSEYLASGIVKAKDAVPIGATVLWRVVNPDDTREQVIYNEVINTSRSPHNIDYHEITWQGIAGDLKGGQFALTFEEDIVGVDYMESDSVSTAAGPGVNVYTLNTMADATDTAKQWHPFREQGIDYTLYSEIPTFEVIDSFQHVATSRTDAELDTGEDLVAEGIGHIANNLPYLGGAIGLHAALGWLIGDVVDIDPEWEVTFGEIHGDPPNEYTPDPNTMETVLMSWTSPATVLSSSVVVFEVPIRIDRQQPVELVSQAEWIQQGYAGPLSATAHAFAGTTVEVSPRGADRRSDDGTDSPDARELQLGILMPTSGDLDFLGTDFRNAAVLPATVVNDADVPVTVDYQVEDTGSENESSVQAAQRLADSDYPAVVGPLSYPVDAARQVFLPENRVVCLPTSVGSETGLADDEYIFRTAPMPFMGGAAGARVAYERIGARTAATISLEGDYTQERVRGFVETFEDNLDGTVQTQEVVQDDQSSYRSVLASAVRDDPDALYLDVFTATGTTLLQDFYADYSAEQYQIVASRDLQSDAVRDNVNASLDNVVGTARLPEGPQNDTFDRQYRDAYGSDPMTLAPHAYDATAVLLLANAAASENDGPAIRDEMRAVANPGGTTVGPANLAEGVAMAASGEDVQYVGAGSTLDFDATGRLASHRYEIWQFDESEDGTERVGTITYP